MPFTFADAAPEEPAGAEGEAAAPQPPARAATPVQSAATAPSVAAGGGAATADDHPPYLAPAPAGVSAPQADPVPQGSGAPQAPALPAQAPLDDVFAEDYAPQPRAAADDYAAAYDDFAEEFAEPKSSGRGLGVLLFIMALLLFAAIAGGIIYFFYKTQGGPAAAPQGQVPVITPQKPAKVRPGEEGGNNKAGQTAPAAQKKPAGRKQIYDRILGDGKEQPSRIVPSEEKPLPPPQAPAAPQGGGEPLPLPPPPALEGGQGSMNGVSAKQPMMRADATPGSKAPAEATPAGAPALPAPPPLAAGQGESGSAPAADARQVASLSRAEEPDTGLATSPAPAQTVQKKIPPAARKAAAAPESGRKAATTARKAADARRKAQQARQAAARRKAADARRKARARRAPRPPQAVAARRATTGGPRPLVPPLADAPASAVRAYAPPPLPPAATAPARPPAAATPGRPARVVNFNSGKRTNFSSVHPPAARQVAALAPATRPPAARSPAARTVTPRTAVARAPAAPAARPAPPAAGGGYVVQLASYRSQADAVREYQRMKARHGRLLGGLAPRIQKKDLGAAGTFYRLAVGPLPSREQARRLCNALIASGERDCLVRRQ